MSDLEKTVENLRLFTIIMLLVLWLNGSRSDYNLRKEVEELKSQVTKQQVQNIRLFRMQGIVDTAMIIEYRNHK